MSDREKAELRGPVKMCVYESTMPDSKKLLTKMEYSLDGKLLTTRTVQSDGSEWVTTQTYDTEGRLVKTASGKLGEPGTESVYAYDEVGRLLSITNSSEKGNRTDFRCDEQGRKTTIQTFDPKTLQSRQNSMFGGSPWDAAQAGFGVHAGGKVTTIYGENDKPTEAQVHDAEGRIVSRLVRIYDANGRIMEENQIQENPALLMVDEFSAEQQVALDDKQLEAMNKAMKSMLSGRSGTRKTYTYDPQGRVKEVRDRNFALDTVTTTSYNEHGDKSEERMTLTDNTAFRLVWHTPWTKTARSFPRQFPTHRQFRNHRSWTSLSIVMSTTNTATGPNRLWSTALNQKNIPLCATVHLRTTDSVSWCCGSGRG